MQATVTVAFDVLQRREQAAAGIPAADLGVGAGRPGHHRRGPPRRHSALLRGPRTRGQPMADAPVERITGTPTGHTYQSTAPPPPGTHLPGTHLSGT
ncbi:MAG: hypothetical protein ABWX85_15040 [Arthrobacter sp.]